MKKVLLLSAAVCMALTMSAQKLPTVENATLSANKTSVSLNAYGNSYAKKVIANTVLPKKAPAKAIEVPTVASLTGLYVCDNSEQGDGTRPYQSSKSFSMEQLDEVVVLEAGTEENPEIYNCNVLIRDLMVPGSELYGVYDETEGTLTLADLQLALSTNYDYYFVNLMSINDEDQVNMSYSIPVVLTVEEDDNGFYFVNNPEYIGFGLVVFDDEGQPLGFGATCMHDVSFTPCNYICDEEQRNALKSENDPWEFADPYGVFIERISDEEFAVHGFMELGTAYVMINEEGVGTMETLQPLQYASVGNGQYAYIGAVKWGIDGEYIKPDYSLPYLNCGFWTFTMKDPETGETSELRNCFALYDDENSSWEYYSPGHEGLNGGAYSPLTVFTLFKPIDTPALQSVKNVTITRKSRDTFNLAGQRVNNAKGIVIENNKKVIR